MERWREVFRNGIAPQLSLAGLEALRGALVRDDWRLRQGQTLWVVGGFRIIQACAVAYAGWRGDMAERVAHVEEFFARVARRADDALAEAGAFIEFVAWFDDTPRQVAFPLLLAEVNRAIARRTDADHVEETSPAETPRDAAERTSAAVHARPDRPALLP